MSGKTILAGKYYEDERMKKVKDGMEEARGGMGSDTMLAPFAGALPEVRVQARARRWAIECRVPGSDSGAQPFFRIEVGPGEYKVGRDKNICDVKTCTDDFCPHDVSRVHAVIVCHATDGRITVRDLGSLNGTQVGGMRIAEGQDIELLPGQSFRVSGAEVSIVELQEPVKEPISEPVEMELPKTKKSRRSRVKKK